MNKSEQSGYTLIELLVVVSIIGLLASSILVAVRKAGIKARDTRRIADVEQFNKALQLWFADRGYYPNCFMYLGCDLMGTNPDGSTNAADTTLDGSFMFWLAPYIGTKPRLDPINTFPYLYAYNAGNFDLRKGTVPFEDPVGSGNYYYYVIGTCLEDPKDGLRVNSIPIPSFPLCIALGEAR